MDTQSQADTLRNVTLGAGEAAKFWREPRYDGLECLSALFRTHVYERHTHETYVIGTIVAGCERFEVAGVQHAARPGDLCFVNPDTVHDGRAEGAGYAYRMIYPSIGLIADIARDLTGRTPRGTLTFGGPIVPDAELSAAFVAAHRAMEQNGSALEVDEAMIRLLGRILIRHARFGASDGPARERRAVARAKDYLEANLAENVDLATLAGIAGLSRSHFVRAFKQENGLTPHAFLIDRRVRLARKRLLGGEPPVAVAAAVGFADQAHMTRAFKARIGVTPGAFARMT
ncbi:MAG: AraC family transcriptional regulator [Dichotomicrobium sp.]